MSAENLENQPNEQPNQSKSSQENRPSSEGNQQVPVSNLVDPSQVQQKPSNQASNGQGEQNRRVSSRYQGKRKGEPSGPEEKLQGYGLTGQKVNIAGKTHKLELTDAEKELFLGNDFLNKLKAQDSLNSSQGTPTNSNVIGRRKPRGEDSLIEVSGVRARKPKNNFSSDFVYGDYPIRGAQGQKVAKDSSNPAVPSTQGPSQTKGKKGGKKSQKGPHKNQIPVPQIQPQPLLFEDGPLQEPIRLYCLCRTADENAEMIGCDKCDEWYHFACVGIDKAAILDIETFEFICPACMKKQGKASAGKKTLQPNKRNMKMQQKKQATDVFDFSAPANNPQNFVQICQSRGNQIQSASVQQKRKFQKNRNQLQQNNTLGVQGKKKNSRAKPNQTRIVLETNLGSGSKNQDMQGGSDYGTEEIEMGIDNDFDYGENHSHDLLDKNQMMRRDPRMGQSQFPANNEKKSLPQRIFDESGSKSNPEVNLEKVVAEGECVYLVSKDNKDKPLEVNVKVPNPDKFLQIKEEHIPNLRNLYLKQLSKEDNQDVVQSVIEILKEKLKSNLCRMPAVYQNAFAGVSSQIPPVYSAQSHGVKECE